MKDLNLSINEHACIQCGFCVKDCPADVLAAGNGLPEVVPEASDACIECQHCLAVCPTSALSVFGVDPRKSLPLSREAIPSRRQMKTLVRGRRTVRQYRDANVSGELIDDLLADIAHAPTGCNDRALDFLVVDDMIATRKLREDIFNAIETEMRTGRQMPDFLVSAVDSHRRKGVDEFFRGAPHLLIVSAADRASCGKTDVVIALAYFELLAQCAGLGTTWCGILDFAAAVVPGIRDILDIGENVPFYGMMFGHPEVKYARMVQRDAAATIRRFHHENTR